jgi:hypothetical protein
MVTFRRVRGKWRRSQETHRLQLFASAGILRALRRSGFAAKVARCYGRFALSPRRLAFIAHKAA